MKRTLHLEAVHIRTLKLCNVTRLGSLITLIADQTIFGNIQQLLWEDTVIHKNDRICQFRIMKKQPEIHLETVKELEGKSRGGFGSTGKKLMDDDLRYREENWVWDAQCAAVDEKMLTCPRCGSIMLPQFQNMNIWELDGKNGMNVPMPHVGIVAKYINYAKENKTMKLQNKSFLITLIK